MSASSVRFEKFFDVQNVFDTSSDNVNFFAAVVDYSDCNVRVAIFLELIHEDRKPLNVILSFCPCEINFCAINIFFAGILG